MIERLHINNYRCFDNFTISFSERKSALIIGLKRFRQVDVAARTSSIFQKICRGPNRVREWLDGERLRRGCRKHIPIWLEIDLKLANNLFKYTIAFDMPEHFEKRVWLEKAGW